MALTLTLSNVQLQEFLQRWRQGIQPWGEFLDSGKFSRPKSLLPVGQRILKNVDRFKSNYVFVVLCIIAFSILTSPILLIAVGFVAGASYFVLTRNQEAKVIFMGREVTVNQQLYAVGLLSFLLLWLFGVGSVVFWIIGVSFALITSHASFYTTVDDVQTTAFVV